MNRINSYNVKLYGALGDGYNDDTSALQELINSVPEGGTIYFPKGNYIITRTLYLKEKIKYIGENWFTKIIRDKTFPSGMPMLYLKAKKSNIESNDCNQNFWISTLEIDGNKQSDCILHGDDGILFEGVETAFLDSLHIINCAGTGINTTSPTLNNTIHIRRCFIRENNLFGIYLGKYTSDTHVIQCDIGRNGKSNIYLAGPSSTIRESTIWGSKTDVGIYCTGVSNHISSCQIEGNARHAVLFADASHCSISTSKIYASVWDGSYGIYIDSYNKIVENIMINNNMIYSSLTNGYSNMEKAIFIHPNHKNLIVFGNSVKFLARGRTTQSKRPFIEGLSLSKGDIWSTFDSNYYIMAGFSKCIDIQSNVYTPLYLSNVVQDQAGLINKNGIINIIEDSIYTLTGHIMLNLPSMIDSTFRLRLVSITKKTTYTLKYYESKSIEPSINFNIDLHLESGDSIYLDFISTHADVSIINNITDSYIIFHK